MQRKKGANKGKKNAGEIYAFIPKANVPTIPGEREKAMCKLMATGMH